MNADVTSCFLFPSLPNNMTESLTATRPHFRRWIRDLHKDVTRRQANVRVGGSCGCLAQKRIPMLWHKMHRMSRVFLATKLPEDAEIPAYRSNRMARLCFAPTKDFQVGCRHWAALGSQLLIVSPCFISLMLFTLHIIDFRLARFRYRQRMGKSWSYISFYLIKTPYPFRNNLIVLATGHN